MVVVNQWMFYRQLPWLASPIFGGYIGYVLQCWEDERLTKFRDKSALYGRELAPGEKPSWP